jgi:ABC-2 type transport system permease protein
VGAIVNIVIRELKANRKSLIIWCIGVLFLIAAGMGKYAGMAGTGETINDLMNEMPESLQAIMGTSGFDLSSALGYYGMLYLYLAVMSSIHAVMLGSTIIAKEERDKTAEFLLVKPVSRFAIVTSKMAAALVNILLLNVVAFLSSISFLQQYAKGEEVSGSVAQLMLGMFLLQIIFLVIGTAAAAVLQKAKKAGALSTGILFLAFVISVIINLNEKLNMLKYMTPFKYFEARPIINGEGMDSIYVALSTILIAVLTAVTYRFYEKKDMNL